MQLNHLQVLNFRNYKEAASGFDKKFNCIAGENGSGKTSLLDAIYYLSFCKSFLTSADNLNIRTGEEFFLIQGDYIEANGKVVAITCSQRKGDKKVFKVNKKDYERLSEHIGLIPLVLVAPEDQILLSGGSEFRRKFLDGIISQYDSEYLNRLIQYNRTLQQRNQALRMFAEQRQIDETILSLYNEQLIEPAHYIFSKRDELFVRFNEYFNEYYHQISGRNEVVNIGYSSRLKSDTMSGLLADSLERDCRVHYTTAGIHRDDLEFYLNGQNARQSASQGQRKTMLISLKLAQYRFVSEKKGTKPLLLLDDLYDKLDERRLALLLKILGEDTFGQVFITDTHSGRISGMLSEMGFSPKEIHPIEIGN